MMSKIYDAVIIGGGINGSGVALTFATAGKKVLLLEKNDFASKTSGASSKLLHGGLRYLKTFDFGLVFEGLRERSRIMKIASKKANAHLLKLIIPVYKQSSTPLWQIKLGTYLYDKLSGFGSSSKQDFPNAGNAKKRDYSNILNQQGLVGLRYYYDGQIDDKQLVKDELTAAVTRGAKALTKSTVTAIQFQRENKTYQISYRNKEGKSVTVQSLNVINCAGPWVKQIDEIAQIKPKLQLNYLAGSHIIIKKQLSKNGFFIMTDDNRNIFALPWQNNSTLIGTTEEIITESDIFKNRIPTQTQIPLESEKYLINNYNKVFKTTINSKDIVARTWGIRVLVKEKNTSHNKTSRKVKIIKHQPGFISVYGGKLTTHLATASKVFKRLYQQEKLPQIIKM